MPWIFDDDEEDEFFRELIALPDRIACILAVTIIDRRLTAAIQANWHDTKIDRERLFDRLFRYSGPLGSFGARIDLGFAMGLYGNDAFRDLHLVRRIRNRFAHELSPKGLKEQSIRDLCANLKLPDLYPIVPEEKRTPITNPTPMQLAAYMLQHSHVSEMSDPRSRYIRTVEIVSIFLSFLSFDIDAQKRDPSF